MPSCTSCSSMYTTEEKSALGCWRGVINGSQIGEHSWYPVWSLSYGTQINWLGLGSKNNFYGFIRRSCKKKVWNVDWGGIMIMPIQFTGTWDVKGSLKSVHIWWGGNESHQTIVITGVSCCWVYYLTGSKLKNKRVLFINCWAFLFYFCVTSLHTTSKTRIDIEKTSREKFINRTQINRTLIISHEMKCYILLIWSTKYLLPSWFFLVSGSQWQT